MKMKWFECFVVISVIAGSLGSEECCVHGQLLVAGSVDCWDPVTDVRVPHLLTCRLDTEKVFGPTSLYTIENNTFYLTIPSGNIPIYNRFCVSNTTSKFDRDLNVRELALFCDTPDGSSGVSKDTVMAWCSIVTVLFLGLTALIYSILPELRDVQGKSIINFCASLAIALLLLAIMILSKQRCADPLTCSAKGYATYFFLLAAFFWTNAISIQILLGIRRPVCVDYGWREFKWYMVYAWGSPALLTIVMAIINFHPGVDIHHSHKPKIGSDNTWFPDAHRLWIYLYSFMSLLLAINICIFIYTFVVIWRTSFNSGHVKALKYKLVMCVRLIFVMGVPWVFEMVSSLVGEGNIVMTIIDIFNTLQGIFIFVLLVVLRRRVVKLMHKRGWLGCMSSLVERYLARGDDEENMAEHTNIDFTVNDIAIHKDNC